MAKFCQLSLPQSILDLVAVNQGLFLHTSPEVSPNFNLIESISVFTLPSPAVSIKLRMASVHKAKIVKAHLKFKQT